MDAHEANTIRRYLLGELPETERQELEQRLFADDEFFDQILDSENELFDGYARGELSGGDKQRFEERLHANRQGEHQLRFAQALARAGPPPDGNSWQLNRSTWLWSLAATTALLAIATVWLSMANREMSGRLLAFERRQAPASTGIFTISLPTSLERGAEPAAAPPIVLPATAQAISLDLDVGPKEPYSTYSVIVRTARGVEIAKFSGLSPITLAGSREVEVYLQSTLLPTGQYEIALSGEVAGRSEPVGFAYLRLSRQP